MLAVWFSAVQIYVNGGTLNQAADGDAELWLLVERRRTWLLVH